MSSAVRNLAPGPNSELNPPTASKALRRNRRHDPDNQPTGRSLGSTLSPQASGFGGSFSQGGRMQTGGFDVHLRTDG